MLYLGVDVGGTFTDLVIFDDSRQEAGVNVVKIPTTRKNPEKGILQTLSVIKARDDVSLIVHATTLATNALLTRSGLAKTALITNHGFRDILEIGRQRRPELYDLYSRRPDPLVKRQHRYGVHGRILANGSELEPLSKEDVRRVARDILREHFDSVAISLLHAYANPAHEIAAAEILKREGYKGQVFLSSEVDKEYREYERTSTTVVNATLAPMISMYIFQLEHDLRREGFRGPVYMMSSDGSAGTVRNASEKPISMIESGPAAGVLASKTLAKALSIRKAITFDMGGTTAKAGALIDGDIDVVYEFEAAGKTHSGRSIKGSGYPVRFPFVDLAEVSAGGGTIAWLDDVEALRVGPQSAGSEPGPAAYGKGGSDPTVTDANLVLGRINPNFLLGGGMKLVPELAHKAISDRISGTSQVDTLELAQRIIRLINNTMAKAISIVSVERGRDPRDFTLIAFGGAGPVHACDMADELGIGSIVVPRYAGLFSAYGLIAADLARRFTLPVMTTVQHSLEPYFEQLRQQMKYSLKEEGSSLNSVQEFVDLRYQGQSFEITLPYESGADLGGRFGKKHTELYGYSSSEPVEVVNARIQAILSTPKPKINRSESIASKVEKPSPASRRDAWFAGERMETPVHARENLQPSAVGTGPCIIEDYDSTSVINPGWKWRIDAQRNILLTREA